jgi:hypothetical protein
MSLLQNLPAEEFAVTLEALDKDSRFFFGHKFRKSWPITSYGKFRIPAFNNWLAIEHLVLMKVKFALSAEWYCGQRVPTHGS